MQVIPIQLLVMRPVKAQQVRPEGYSPITVVLTRLVIRVAPEGAGPQRKNGQAFLDELIM